MLSSTTSKLGGAVLCLLVLNNSTANADPAAYAVCQTGCAALVTVCYAVAGVPWGVAITAPLAVAEKCDSAFGKCYAKCAKVTLP